MGRLIQRTGQIQTPPRRRPGLAGTALPGSGSSLSTQQAPRPGRLPGLDCGGDHPPLVLGLGDTPLPSAPQWLPHQDWASLTHLSRKWLSGTSGGAAFLPGLSAEAERWVQGLPVEELRLLGEAGAGGAVDLPWCLGFSVSLTFPYGRDRQLRDSAVGWVSVCVWVCPALPVSLGVPNCL